MKKYLLLLITLVLLVPHITVSAEPEFADQTGYKVIIKNGFYGLMDTAGASIVIPPEYDRIYPVEVGYCIAQKAEQTEVWNIEKGMRVYDGEIEVMNIVGHFLWVNWDIYDLRCCKQAELTQEYYCLMKGNDEQHIIAGVDSDGDIHYGILDKDGQVILPCDYHYVVDSANGSIATIFDGNVKYYDLRKKEFLPGAYWSGSVFQDGFGVVAEDRESYYLIDNEGVQRTRSFRQILLDDHDDAAVTTNLGCFAYKEEDGWYLGRVSSVSLDPDILHGPLQAEDCSYLGDGIWAFCDKNRTTLIDPLNHKEITLSDVSYVMAFSNGVAKFGNNTKKVGFIRNDLSILAEPQFDAATSFLGNFAFVKMNGSYYPIDRYGFVNMSVKYDEIEIYSGFKNEWFFYMSDNGMKVILNEQLEPITMI